MVMAIVLAMAMAMVLAMVMAKRRSSTKDKETYNGSIEMDLNNVTFWMGVLR